MNNMTQFTENANRPGDKSRVLIIDDEPDIVTYLKLLLEENGYAADAAASAEEGLALVAERPPDLILLDIMMPRMTGLAFYRELKQMPGFAHIPAVIVSAFSRTRDFPAQQFDEFLAENDIPKPAAFIEKPIERESFLKTVEAVIRGGVKEIA